MEQILSRTRFDVEAVRKNFPLLERTVKGRPLVYLDNAATTQKPQQVLDALIDYYSNHNANIHRGIHTLAEEATASFEETRDILKDFLGAAEREEIIFTRGATEGINLVMQTWGLANIKADDEIVISAMEHHSNIVPWSILCERTGANLRVIPVDESGDLDLEAFQALLSERTKLVAVVHASNVLGTVNPVKSIIAMAKEFGAVTLIDGAQSSVHLDINVQDLDCDFFVCSSHKVYGPTGIGVLYGKRAILEAMPVFQGGGEMIKEVYFDRIIYNDLPYKFEAGTPNIADTIAWKAALEYVQSLGKHNVRKYENSLLDYCTNRLEQIEGLQIIGKAREKVSLNSFVIQGIHPQDLGILLDNKGIAVRTGHHCAQPLMDRFCIPGTTRASFAMYNTIEEIDQLISGIEKAVTLLR